MRRALEPRHLRGMEVGCGEARQCIWLPYPHHIDALCSGIDYLNAYDFEDMQENEIVSSERWGSPHHMTTPAPSQHATPQRTTPLHPSPPHPNTIPPHSSPPHPILPYRTLPHTSTRHHTPPLPTPRHASLPLYTPRHPTPPHRLLLHPTLPYPTPP